MWALLLLIPIFVLGVGLILWLEERYYDKHPEKDRPDVSMWP